MKYVMYFGKKSKLSPRYMGPHKIITRMGKVPYELDLPIELTMVHLVFHVSMLRKCIGDSNSIVPLKDVTAEEDLNYEEVPIEILDRQVKKLRNKELASVKALWRNQQVDSATLEVEAYIIKQYPYLFPSIQT